MPGNGPKNKKPEAPVGWVPATPYDYESHSQAAAHDWECNAKAYGWDGEVVDTGPGFSAPGLSAPDIELLDEPDNRVKQGIDFSKYAEDIQAMYWKIPWLTQRKIGIASIELFVPERLGACRPNCDFQGCRVSEPGHYRP